MKPADAVVLASVPVVLVIDAILWERGHELITHTLRNHKKVFFAGSAVLALHVLDVLGPVDPFGWIGKGYSSCRKTKSALLAQLTTADLT
jgi:hypothetical protein